VHIHISSRTWRNQNASLAIFLPRELQFILRLQSTSCRTDGPDGDLQDDEITHTFGVDPLQQYLIGFPDGRFQMLGLAWDTRRTSWPALVQPLSQRNQRRL
jgi:hypothetical protein